MGSFQKIIRFPPVPVCFISGLCFFVVLVIQSLGFLENIELTAYDMFTRSRPKPVDITPRILIVKISETDILTQGRWPLTDATLAHALKNLLQHNPRAVGLDIFRDVSIPPGSSELEAVLISNPHIICVTKFGSGGVPPPKILEGTGQVGFNDMLVDPGGIIRRGLLFLDNGKQVVSAFNLLLALHFLQKEGIIARPDELNPDYLKLGRTTITPLEKNDGGYVNADARGYQYFIDFKDATGFYRSYSLTRLLSGELDPGDIQDKIVLIGVVAQSVKDHFYTPFSRGFQADQQMPGVVLHAHLASQLIRFGLHESRPIKTVKEKQEMLFMLLGGLMGGSVGFLIRSPWRFSMAMAGGLFFLWLFSYVVFLNRWWIPVVPPSLTWILSAGVITAYISSREKKQRAVLMRLFSKHVSREIADAVWAQRDQFLYRGRPRPRKMPVTVLFSDIRGFTTISETLDPHVLIEWLNTYMDSMAKTVMAHGGVVDDYAGDGIKANFGIPFPRKTEAEIGKDAINAVNCAISMGTEMEKLNTLWLSQGLPQAGIRIGIFTGWVVAGALGSSERMKYTTVGDVVNIAARLESYDKDFSGKNPWRILIGETTLNYLNGTFTIQRIGETGLKGKKEKVNIYWVLGARK
ncbi:adenylate/guanylate cyclase domain-containing protein [Desulfobacula sp.]|uniref:CHASE2 domain-containing protein n=1 Tax=Desulfobacula sp. TaxID=2593537 RepID=UPI00260E1F8F|nr:adenylate/guanylate cyclase domain-containing protein [Desulfobacula sp.]